MELVSKIIDYESGEMEAEEVIPFFAELVKSKLAWQLQGSYGRQAQWLIDNKRITEDGEII